MPYMCTILHVFPCCRLLSITDGMLLLSTPPMAYKRSSLTSPSRSTMATFNFLTTTTQRLPPTSSTHYTTVTTLYSTPTDIVHAVEDFVTGNTLLSTTVNTPTRQTALEDLEKLFTQITMEQDTIREGSLETSPYIALMQQMISKLSVEDTANCAIKVLIRVMNKSSTGQHWGGDLSGGGGRAKYQLAHSLVREKTRYANRLMMFLLDSVSLSFY